MNLIEELLFAALLADNTAAVRSLGDNEIVIRDLSDRESQLIHAWNTTPIIVVVSTGTLTAALKQMTCHNATGQVVPVI